MQHELEMKKLDYDNALRRKKIQLYEEKMDLDCQQRYFKEATNKLPEEKRRFEIKKAFLNSYVARHIKESDYIEEIYKIIYSHHKLTAEDYLRKSREIKFDSDKSVVSFIADQRFTMNRWIYSILDEESIESIKTWYLKEKLYNRFNKDVQRKLLEEKLYKKI